MRPLVPLGRSGRHRGIPPRVVFLLVVTVVTIGALWLTSRGSSPRRDTATRHDAPRRPGATTTTRPTTTTAYRFAINSDWLPKSSSRYSESASAKAERDALGVAAAPTTTTVPVAAPPDSATTTTRPRSATTTTAAAKRPTTTAPPPATTVVTEPPTTLPPTVPDPPATPAGETTP